MRYFYFRFDKSLWAVEAHLRLQDLWALYIHDWGTSWSNWIKRRLSLSLSLSFSLSLSLSWYKDKKIQKEWYKDKKIQKEEEGNLLLMVQIFNNELILSFTGTFWFQREFERRAATMGGGNFVVPAQNVTDFLENKLSGTYDKTMLDFLLWNLYLMT